MHSSHGVYGLFLTCGIKGRVSYLHVHITSKCCLLDGLLSTITSSTYLSSYGVKGAAANETNLASLQKQTDPASSFGHIAGDAFDGFSMLPAWLGLAELGLPRFECRSKVTDLESL
jgi:hypothetical protein